jgi:hypothetical protein
MITKAQLVANNYRYFENRSKRSENLSAEQDPYKGLYQKCIQDAQGKKYFINFDCWDFANSAFSDRNVGRVMSFEASVQFTLPNGDSLNVEYLSAQNRTLQAVENFFEKMWRDLEAQHYEKNEVA